MISIQPTPPVADAEDAGEAIHPSSIGTFSFEEFLSSSLASDFVDATVDIGLVDDAANDNEADVLDEDLIERAYNEFFGTSPLSTAPPSPETSRSPSPIPEASLNQHKRSRSPSPEPSTQRPAPLPPTQIILDAASATLQSGNSKSRRDKKKVKKSKKKKRLANPEPTPAAHTKKNHLDKSQELKTKYDAKFIPSTSTGYIAHRDEKDRVYELPELLAMGFKLVKWDGSRRSSRPILDKNGLVVAVLVGRPNDVGWDDVCDAAYDTLKNRAPSFNFSAKTRDHRRGKFPAVNVGISYGGGQMKPGNLCHTKKQAALLDEILASTCFIRVAGFQSSAFKSWMPQVHAYYERDFNLLIHRYRRLRRNFDNSVWASAALNFGPTAVTARHRDWSNLPFGICAVTSLGKYNATKGGHVVLWELGLVIEFPPGSTVLIPSAAISHSNTPISKHERRASFTQYSAGGLFRWVQHGFQTEANFRDGMTDDAKKEVIAENRARCKLGLLLFPKLSDLRKPPRKGSPNATH